MDQPDGVISGPSSPANAGQMLQITVAGVTQVFPPSTGDIMVGRAGAAQVVVSDPQVSRHHLRVHHEDAGWMAHDVNSVQGTWFGGRRITHIRVDEPMVLHLGDQVNGVAVELVPGTSAHIATKRADLIRVGRAGDNDIVIDDLLTARYHARLTATHDGFFVEDLDKHHQTFVGGSSIETAHVREGAVITFGKARFVVTVGGLHPIPDAPVSGGLVVERVSYALPDGTVLTHDIDFDVAGPALIGVIGPSGAGKSTLLRLINGELEPTEGFVRYQGIDTHHNQEEIHGRIGVVPQHTIAHVQLTARKALNYTAELRLSPDTTATERTRRVDEVLTELGLDEHADIPIRLLSGGQQRRLAIGFELITRPSLLILDEPTAGLDPALVRQIMTGLRDLVRDGRQVIVTTHDLMHLHMCDDVIVLRPGGYVEYVGPPAGIEAHFGTSNWADIFEKLSDEDKKPSTTKVMAPRHRPRRRFKDRLSDVVGPQAAYQRRLRQQMWVLCRRQLRLIIADRGYAGFLLALPIALGLLTFAIPDETGLGRPFDPTSTEAVRLLIILVVGAAFMSMAATVRDLVAERQIFRHERAAGLIPDAYLAAKLIVFCGVGLIQALILLRLTLWFRAGPDDGVIIGSGKVEIGVALIATAMVSAILGLLISSLVATPEQTMPPLVITIMAQLVLCGGLIEVTGRPVVSELAWLVPSRWGYASAASTVNVTTIVPHTPNDLLWRHNPVIWLGALLVLTAMGAAFAYLTRRRLHMT